MKLNTIKGTVTKGCVGIDVSKAELAVCLTQRNSSEHHTIKGTRKFENTPAGFKALQTWIERLRPAGDIPLTVVMEATGVYYESCAYFLRDAGYRLSVILPSQAKNYAKSRNAKSKNDQIDARLLADFGLERNLPAWQGLSPTMLTIKHLCREQATLHQQRTSVLNRLHAQEHSYHPDKATLRRLRQQLRLLEKQLEAVEKQLQAVLAADAKLSAQVKNLCTIKGIGWLTALIVLAETNAFELFTNKGQVVSYAGYDVVEHESGTSVRGRRRISKKGNAHLRRALHLPALNAVRYEPKFQGIYQRINERNPKVKMIGLVAVQRKLLILLYTLYKKNEAYDPSYEHPTTLKKSRQDAEPCLHSIVAQA